MPVAKMQEVEKRFGCPLIELWGMTELAGLGTTFPSNGPHKLGSIGIAAAPCGSPHRGCGRRCKTMPRGEVGELMIRGPIVMQGYYGNEEATREAIEPDGWLHTGDLGSMDEDGAVFIVDRKKDMINTGGFKVFPAEIERVVAQHPTRRDGRRRQPARRDEGRDRQGLCGAEAGRHRDAEGIIAFCRERARRLQSAARSPVRGRPAENLDRQDHAPGTPDTR